MQPATVRMDLFVEPRDIAIQEEQTVPRQARIFLNLPCKHNTQANLSNGDYGAIRARLDSWMSACEALIPTSLLQTGVQKTGVIVQVHHRTTTSPNGFPTLGRSKVDVIGCCSETAQGCKLGYVCLACEEINYVPFWIHPELHIGQAVAEEKQVDKVLTFMLLDL